MFAVIKSGGKQYKVEEGDVLKIEYQDCKKGDIITFEEVLCISNKEKTTYGKPVISNASVTATVLEQIKDKKVLIFKKRRRQNSRSLNGHRQMLTVVKVKGISAITKKTNNVALKDDAFEKEKVKSPKAINSTEKKPKVKEK